MIDFTADNPYNDEARRQRTFLRHKRRMNVVCDDGSILRPQDSPTRGSRTVAARVCKLPLSPVVRCMCRAHVEDVMDAQRDGSVQWVVPSVRDSANVGQREDLGYDPVEHLLKKQAQERADEAGRN